MSSSSYFLKFLLCASSLIGVLDAALPSNPEEGLTRYSDFCLGLPPSQDSCCHRIGLNVIQDDDIVITASTVWPDSTNSHGPERAALYEVRDLPKGISGWSVSVKDRNQWIQVDFGSPRTITGVLLQGRGQAFNSWVTSYRVLFSNDGEMFTSTPTFEGTFDLNTVARRMFQQPIVARYFRINPITWNNHITLRFDSLGCKA